MLTREEIAETLKTEPNNRNVYGLGFGDFSLSAARDIETDSGIAFDAQAWNLERAARGELSEGDFIKCIDGGLDRVANICQRETSDGCCRYQPGHNRTNGSFYLFSDSMSFSGGLDSSVARRLQFTGETMPGRVWFFSLRESGAGRGVYCSVNVPVWREVSP